MSATMRPYSMAVAADSSARNPCRVDFIGAVSATVKKFR
jgi:hypothetical protein